MSDKQKRFWDKIMSEDVNPDDIKVYIDGKEITGVSQGSIGHRDFTHFTAEQYPNGWKVTLKRTGQVVGHRISDGTLVTTTEDVQTFTTSEHAEFYDLVWLLK